MVVCTAFHTHSIESAAQSMRRVVFAPFYDEILAQSLSPSSSTTVSGPEAEQGVRPETFLPLGLCFVPSAEVTAREPHPPDKGRCPPLRSVALARCPTLCLISQMPSPSVTAVSSSRWALTPCLGQDSLLTWAAPSCSGCWRSPMPSAPVACFSAAGKQVRGAEQQAYQQGELLGFPS